MSSLNFLGYLHPREWPKHLNGLGVVAPLIASVIAPFSVLLDIPALTEQWYASNGQPVADPVASLALSSVSLAFGIIANALLIIRFSTNHYDLRIKLWVPLCVACWIIRVLVGLVNLILFGAITRNTPSYSFLEGFWCATVSLITSGLVTALLVYHFFTDYLRQRKGPEHMQHVHRQVRISGRHFMLSTTLFIAWIALMALVFSRIEGWSYLDGIYFSLVTVETVGFGDFEPVHSASRVLLFPFSLIGIAFLGTLIQMIVNFFSDRSAARKEKSRALYERERQEAEDKDQDPANLQKEIAFLNEINQKQDVQDQFLEFAMSFTGFTVFWLIGGAIFMALESQWSFGVSMYFCYVLFFTIGYGDFSPTSPGGKVFFIVYSLLAVPIMASFALQAITQVFTRLSTWRLESRREEHGLSVPSPPDDRVITHAEYLAKHHERFDKMFARTDTRESDESDGTAAQKDQDALETVQDANQRLVVEMIQRAVALESHARRLLVRHLPNGSRAQVVLKADRNIQLRDLRYLKRSEKDSEGATRQTQQVKAAERAQKPKETELARHARSMAKEEGTDQDPGQLDVEKDPAQLKSELEGDGDEDWVSEPLGEEATLAEVQAYRESFAALLVAGTRLQQLEGQEMYMLERRRPREASSS